MTHLPDVLSFLVKGKWGLSKLGRYFCLPIPESWKHHYNWKSYMPFYIQTEKHRPNTALARRDEIRVESSVACLRCSCFFMLAVQPLGPIISAQKVVFLVFTSTCLWRNLESSSGELLSSLGRAQSHNMMFNELNIPGLSSYFLEAMKMVH